MRTMLALLAAGLLLASCAKPSAPEVPLAGSAAVSAVLTTRDAASTELPDRVRDDLSAALRERGLVAAFETSDALAGASSTERRLELAVAAQPEADLVVLLEAHPVFSSQMAGRYRWQVDVDLTLAHPGGEDGPRTWSWELPVFLLYHHQREADALAEAAPMLRRKLDAALDEFVGSAEAAAQ